MTSIETATRLIDMSLKPGRSPASMLVDFAIQLEAFARNERAEWMRENIKSVTASFEARDEALPRDAGSVSSLVIGRLTRDLGGVAIGEAAITEEGRDKPTDRRRFVASLRIVKLGAQ